jgi:hypothetical protein
MSSTGDKTAIEFIPNDEYSKKDAGINIVTIPKETLEFVNVGKYRVSQSMEHMPLVRSIESKFNALSMGVLNFVIRLSYPHHFLLFC